MIFRKPKFRELFQSPGLMAINTYN